MPIDTYPAPVQSTPSSQLGYAELGANVSGLGATLTALGVSVTVSVPVGRRVKVTAQCLANVNNSGDETGNLLIMEGATALAQGRAVSRVAGINMTLHTEAVLSPAAGVHTYSLSFERESGTGTWTVIAPGYCYLLVEDITGGTGGPGPIQLAYAEVTTDQTGITSTEVDLTGLSVTVNVPAGRRLRITGHGMFASNTANDEATGHIKEGSTYLGRFAKVPIPIIGNTYLGEGSVVITPTAGTHTYKLAARATSGTVSFAVDAGGAGTRGTGWISVDDITGTPSPAGIMPTSQTLGYAQILTAQNGIGTGATDVTGLAVTITVPEGRRIRLSAYGLVQKRTSASFVWMRIHEGATARASALLNVLTDEYETLMPTVVLTPTAGTHTYKVVMYCGSNTVDLIASSDYPAYILAEDITGGAPAVPPVNVPVGLLGYASISSTQAGITTTAPGTPIVGLSVNVVVPAGRSLKVTVNGYAWNSSANAQTNVRTMMDGVQIKEAADREDTANTANTIHSEVIVSPAAGAHVFSVNVSADSGGSVTFGGVPASIMVEDVTATPAPAVGAPSSTLGYAEVTTSQGSITTMTDITGLVVTVTVPAGRRLRITGYLPEVVNNTLNLGTYARIVEDGVNVGQGDTSHGAANAGQQLIATVVRSPTAGTHVYKIQIAPQGGGTVTVGSYPAYPSFLLVEDITGVDFPPYTVAIQPTSQTLAYAEVTANQASITTEADLTGLNVTVVVPDGRRIKITGYARLGSSTAGDDVRLAIKEGATLLQIADMDTQEQSGIGETFTATAIITPSAGTHTYKLTAARIGGSGSVSSFAGVGYPSFILVEDVTGGSPVVAPVSVPVGQLAYASISASQTGITGSNTAIAGLSVNVAVPAGRTLRITAVGHGLSPSTVPDRFFFKLFEDGVEVRMQLFLSGSTTLDQNIVVSTVRSPTAGAHTYQAYLAIAGGTGTFVAASDRPAFIIVEDITPTPAPSTGAPGSTLGYAEVLADQTLGATFNPVTITVPAGRRVKISAKVFAWSTVTNDVAALDIKEGGTTLQIAQVTLPLLNSGGNTSLYAEVVISPSAGTHTYTMLVRRAIGSGTVTVSAGATIPAFLLVEDVTGSVWPTGSPVTPGMIASEAWPEWTPVFGQGVALTTTKSRARYSKIGRQVTADFIVTVASTGTAGQSVTLNPPVPAAVNANYYPIGVASFYSAGTKYLLIAEMQSGGTVRFQFASGTTDATLGAAAPFAGAVVSGQILAGTITYEAAS